MALIKYDDDTTMVHVPKEYVDLDFDEYEYVSDNNNHTSSFLENVESTLKQFVGVKIKKFRLWLCNKVVDRNQVDRIISFALKNGVQILDIDSSGGNVRRNIFGTFDEDRIQTPMVLPTESFTSCTSLTSLNLVFFGFLCPLPSLENLTRLETISLFLVSIVDETVEAIVSSCPALRKFVLRSCYCTEKLKLSSSLSLESLEISNCYDCDNCPGLSSLYLDLPNLLHFYYVGRIGTIEVGPSTQIATCSMEIINEETFFNARKYPKLNPMFRKAENLAICGWLLKGIWKVGRVRSPFLFRCKSLSIQTGLSLDELKGLRFLFANCQRVESLSITITQPSLYVVDENCYWDEVEDTFRSIGHYLKEIEIHGLSFKEDQIGLIEFLAKRAMVLKKLLVVHGIEHDEVSKNFERHLNNVKVSENAKVEFKKYM